jgi:AGCS family alanine or glycine:cation symporter
MKTIRNTTQTLTFLLFLLLGLSFSTQAQNLSVEVVPLNPSENINDGQAVARISGGTPPYRYQWSNAATPLQADTCKGLTEGTTFKVVVTDATGKSIEVQGVVKPESIVEHINAIFAPAVDAMAMVLFWDPFAALGLYDPEIKVEEAPLKAPFFVDASITQIKIEKWLVANGAKVSHEQPVARIYSNKETRELRAKGEGILKIHLPENTVVYDANLKSANASDVVRLNNGVLASIQYDNPQPLLNPNGTPQTMNIPFVVIWLVLGATFFTLRMGFINIFGIKHALDLIRGKYDNPNKDAGEVSHFQALTAALSGTVGLGNIAGVAVAITVGGPGATLWMIVAGFLGMTSKFVECTLSVKYRLIDSEGTVFGGPMYYLSQALSKYKLGNLGKVLAVIFAILCVGGSFGGGNMFQANQAFQQLAGQIPFLEGRGFVFGIFFAAMVAVVIIGGIKSIAKVTDKIVPFMCGIYLAAALVIILINITAVGDAIMLIFTKAFDADAAMGGAIGVLVQGFRRAAFSNEAGVGSASIAHSAAKTNEPISEGIVALLEPFIDTVVVCTMTALVIIITGEYANQDGLTGTLLTSKAFGESIPWFPTILTFVIVLFAFSTMISWSYYGEKAWAYLFGQSKVATLFYKALFLIFVVIGSSIQLGAVIDFSDMMILGMAFPNILGLFILSPEVARDLKDYFRRIKSGEIKRFG